MLKKHAYRHWPLWVSLPLLAVTTPSLAQESWKGSIGGGVIHAPNYLGSDDYESEAWPVLNLRYGERFYFNLRDGFGWNIVREGNWRVSPFIGYILGRDNEDDLRRLDDVDGGATAGLRVAYLDNAWVYSAAAQTPLSGDVDGYQLKLKAHWHGRLSEQWSASFGPTLTYSSDNWTQDIFGISSRESARSGLDAYEPSDGYFRAGIGGSLSYWLTPEWSVTAMAGVTRLTGDAEDSPIVDDIGNATQAYTGAFVSYRF